MTTKAKIYVERDPLDLGTLRALTAASIPVNPPSAWFQDPGLTAASPLVIEDDGRVYGHIAAWRTNHIGRHDNTRPPVSASGYSYFKTGVIRTAEGSDVPVGQLTLSGGHAPLSAGAAEAVKHYDDTASAIADISVGEDKHGIWAAGALRPSATPEQIRALRASAPSGDWRPINGNLELVACCQVNVPGFPIARARVASGMITGLVAAGAQELYSARLASALGYDARIAELEAQVQTLTASAAEQRRAELRARVKGA